MDIPGKRVDFVVESPKPFHLEPLFTRDPALISELRILMDMMAISVPKTQNRGVDCNPGPHQRLSLSRQHEFALEVLALRRQIIVLKTAIAKAKTPLLGSVFLGDVDLERWGNCLECRENQGRFLLRELAFCGDFGINIKAHTSSQEGSSQCPLNAFNFGEKLT